MEMNQQIQKSQSELAMTRIQLQRNETNLRILKLANSEVSNSKQDHVWESVGKIFLKTSVQDYSSSLKNETTSINDAVKALKTKETYLQTTLENTVQAINKYVGKPSS